MARRPSHVALNVFQNSRLVGNLRKAPSGAVSFRYADHWLTASNPSPVSLSMPLREEPYTGGSVINVFENLLPDELSIRRRIAERVGAAGTDVYSLLSVIGADCVGALQFLPEGHDPGPAGQIEAEEVTDDEIARTVATLGNDPLGITRENDFRISLAGAQEKTALLRMDGRWYRPHHTTATTHILKPRIGRRPNGLDLSSSVENEYVCLRLLKAFGLSVADAEIVDFGIPTLVVERFDRIWTPDGLLLRRPQEDFCQALSVPPNTKYQSDGGPGLMDVVKLLRGSDDPERDIRSAMTAAILFWLLGATDGHAKNLSLFLVPRGFSLTPLYDVLSTQPNVDAGEIPAKAFKLAMSVGKTRHYLVGEIMPRHFLQTADAAGIGGSLVRDLFQQIAARIEPAIAETVASLPSGFPEALVASVAGGLRRRGRLLESPLDA